MDKASGNAWPVPGFAHRIVAWQRQHGRHGLPWQGAQDPYRVWVSEIMLQQTQAATVARYYPRFLARFPDVQALADASLDEVLGLWSGLGYYRRARLLHRCARQVVAEHGGRFPRTAAQLATLPGIGRTTAAAIAAFCFGERQAILDGNVRRVLARVFAIDADLQRGPALRALWQRAEALLPRETDAMATYTQGLMDLGAAVCTPRAPQCGVCPLQDQCRAAAEGRPGAYPMRRRLPARKQQTLWLLHAMDPAGRVWLERRASQGIWGGLHCLPVFASQADLQHVLPSNPAEPLVRHAPVQHLLTHRELQLHMVSAVLPAGRQPQAAGRWFAAARWPRLGLPAPVRSFLEGY